MLPEAEKTLSWPERLRLHGPGILLVAGLLVIAATFRDYGVSWDEKVQSTYGELALEYLLTGFGAAEREQATTYLNLRFYGPVVEMVAAAVYRGFGLEELKFEVRHLLSALAGLLAVCGVWRLGKLLGLPLVQLFAALALVFMPRFYGHSFVNSKDIPFAAAFTWAMLAIGLLLREDGWRWRRTIWCGLAIGLALAIRMGALLLPFFLAVLLVVRVAQQWETRRDWLNRVAVGHLAAMAGLAWLVMIAFWPWAHEHPFLHPWQAFRIASDFSSSYPVLFAGEVWQSNELPWTYVPWYLLITMPVPLQLLAFCGLGAGLIELRKGWRSPQALLVLLIGLWSFFPIVYVIFQRPNVYDGVRHFLFVLPAFALWAGYGGACLRAREREPRARRLVTAIVVVLLLVPVKDLVRLHPYQMTYFNLSVGGVTGAWQNYETDYWTTSYKEAIEWVNALAVRQPDETVRVVVAANPNNLPCITWYAAPNVEVHRVWTGNEPFPRPFDFYISTTRYDQHQNFADIPIVHTIGPGRAIFTVIRSPHGR